MLSRQIAPLLRKFCKVGAYFTIASQRGHALTMLRSFKVILNFSAQYHVAHADSLPSFQHVNNITISQRPSVTPAAMPGNTLSVWSMRTSTKRDVCSKLRTTWAAAPDAVHRPGVWAWGSSLRAEPVSWQPCAHVGRLPPSHGSCARTVFHTPCDASSHEKRPRVASSSFR